MSLILKPFSDTELVLSCAQETWDLQWRRGASAIASRGDKDNDKLAPPQRDSLTNKSGQMEYKQKAEKKGIAAYLLGVLASVVKDSKNFNLFAFPSQRSDTSKLTSTTSSECAGTVRKHCRASFRSARRHAVGQRPRKGRCSSQSNCWTGEQYHFELML